MAVVVGIDAYGAGIPPLRSAVNDARRLSKLLVEHHGYEPITLLDGEATRQRILDLLTVELPATLGEDDRVLFYWGGHGVARDGDDGPAGFLIPVDARPSDTSTFLDMPVLHDALVALECRHMLVVLDACFSGAFRWSGARDLIGAHEIVHREKYDRYVRSAAWQVITSAAQDQNALDQLSTGVLGSRDGAGAHSPFALALFRALDGEADLLPRDGGDGLVTASELYVYLEDQLQSAVECAGKDQTPRLWPLRKHDKGEFVFFVPGRELSLPPAPPLRTDTNPWVGLAAYDTSDAGLFFGRDSEVAALRERVASSPLTIVLGASGTGKSSLVRAGLVPTLVADGAHVLPVVRPGTSLLRALAHALELPMTATGPSVGAGTYTPWLSDAVAERMRELAIAISGVKVVVVIDQFEELITLSRSQAERDHVLALLERLVRNHPDALRIVITLRSDFEASCDHAFGDLWRPARYIVPPMSRTSLRAAIEEPAARRVMSIEPSSLVETLLDEVAATPGALPLLSFALSEMYLHYLERRSMDRSITQEDYDALGGVVGAMRTRAELEYGALDDPGKETLRRLMLRLVISSGTDLARRRATDAELDFSVPAENGRVAEVVRRFTDARLLTKGKDPDGESFVEPSHDALVRGWGRLLGWVREAQDEDFSFPQRQRLAKAAEEWSATEPAARQGMLWSDPARSAQLSRLTKDRQPWLNVRELDFARRSIRRRRLTRLATVGAIGLIVVSSGLATLAARRAAQRADQVRIGATIRTAATMQGSDPLTPALLLGTLNAEGLEASDDATRLAFLATWQAVKSGIRVARSFALPGTETCRFSLSTDRRWVVHACDGSVLLQRSDGGGSTITVPVAAGTSGVPEFSPDGTRALLVGTEGMATLWRLDAASGQATRLAAWPGVTRAGFSPGGNRVGLHVRGGPVGGSLTDQAESGTVSAQADEGARFAVYDADGDGPLKAVGLASIPDPGTRQELPSLDASDVVDVRFDAEDRVVIARTSPRGLSFWRDSIDSAPFRVLEGFPLDSVVLLPDVRRLIAPAAGDSLALWDLAGGSARCVVPDLFTTGRSWSASGDRFLQYASDRAEVWDLPSCSRVATIAPGRSSAPGGTFELSPGGTRVLYWPWVTMLGRSEPMTFEIRGAGSANQTPIALPGTLGSDVRFLDDERILVVRDRVAHVWDLRGYPFVDDSDDAEPIGWIRAVGNLMLDAATWSEDGTLLAVATRSNEVRVLRVAGPPGEILVATAERQKALAFTEDGSRLVGLSMPDYSACGFCATPDPTLRVWSPADGRYTLLDRSSLNAYLSEPARTEGPFAEDQVRRALARVGAVGSVLREGVTTEHGDTVLASAVSHDGRHRAIAYVDRISHRREGATREWTAVLPDGERVARLAFTHDGARLAVALTNGSVRLYRTDRPTVIRELAPAEPASRRFHTGPARLTFSRDDTRLMSFDGSTRLWSVPTGESIAELPGLADDIPNTAFLSPEGRHVVYVTNDQKRRLTWAMLLNADGSGTPVSLSPNGESVTDVLFSPDGRWLLTWNSMIAGVQVRSLHPPDILRALRQTSLCLPVADRRAFLAEPADEASARFAECERARGR